MPRKLIDVAGQRFGRLVATEYLGKPGRFKWLCQCDCGTETKVSGYQLRSGATQSCGCLDRETTAARNAKHGGSVRGAVSPEYRVYRGIIRRCDGTAANSQYYSGRGIQICDRWRNGENGATGYECFLTDMGERPSADHSIERLDNDGNYEPTNCRWATKVEQARNKSSNRMVNFDGVDMPLSAACEMAGMPYAVILDRMNKLGWSFERAIAKKTIGRWA